jgi:hypothetical protein
LTDCVLIRRFELPAGSFGVPGGQAPCDVELGYPSGATCGHPSSPCRSPWRSPVRRRLAVAEQVSEQPIEFRMTFPESAAVEEGKGLPRMVLSETNCARFQERRE